MLLFLTNLVEYYQLHLKEKSIHTEKNHSDLLYEHHSKIITIKKPMRRLKGVKSIFESVLNMFRMLRRKLIHLSIQRHKNW